MKHLGKLGILLIQNGLEKQIGKSGEDRAMLIELDVLGVGAYIFLNEDFIRTSACSFQTAFLIFVPLQDLSP